MNKYSLLYKEKAIGFPKRVRDISDYTKIFDNVDMFLMLYYRNMSFCLNVYCVWTIIYKDQCFIT